jgi:cytidyltransferase-like protein
MSVKSILSNSVRLSDRFIPDPIELAKTIATLRECGNTVSMTQGVYDLIHPGHTRYIERAKSFADVLVVAVDSDEYTRKRKQKANERRPVVPFEERLELLANLRTVDILTVRELKEHDEDPMHIIRVVHPDVLVMSRSTADVGEEWYAKLREHCGRLEVLDPQALVTSTSRLRELMMDGAGGLVDCITEAIENHFQQGGREVHFGKKEKKG